MSKSYKEIGISIANSMVGSSMILFPIVFKQRGVILCTLEFFIASIMSFTCKLLVDQLEHDQKDIGQAIYRKMGPYHGRFFSVLSSILLFLVSSVFFLLAVDVLFDCFDELFDPINISQKTFKLIFVGVFALLNYLKDLKYVFKLAPAAMGALVISTIVLIISIAFNTDHINKDFISFKQISGSGLLDVASVIGFAFICHPTIGPIIKQNKDQRENDKSIYFGYVITVILYVLVGILGSLAIYGRHPVKNSNIIDYFSGQFQSPLIGILTFLYLFIISPIFPFVSKNQAIELIPKQKRQKISNLFLKSSIIYSIFWVPLSIVFIVTQTAPSKVIGFISTVVAFYITYLIPIVMTFKKKNYISKHEQNPKQSLLVPDQNQKITQNVSLLTSNEKQQINDKPNNFSLWQKGFYGFVLLYGTLMLIFELISFFFGF